MKPITTESGVPIPDTIGRGNTRRYPWSTMRIGDSINLPTATKLQAARNSAYVYKKKNPSTFNYGACRDPENRRGGGRLWRIEVEEQE